jgi:hypothetical protein
MLYVSTGLYHLSYLSLLANARLVTMYDTDMSMLACTVIYVTEYYSYSSAVFAEMLVV